MSGNFTEMEDYVNSTLTCAAKSISGPAMLPYSPTLITTMRSIQTLFYIIIFAFGIILNTLVIVLVAKYKKLQTRSFAIALQVVVLDLFLSCTVFMLRPISSIANEWLFGEVMCILTGYILLSYLLVRALLMLAFAIDRFLTVFFLFSYLKHSSIIMITLSVSAWVFSLCFRIMGFPGILDCYSFVSTSFLCVHSSRCSSACAIAANVNLGILLGPSTIIPIVLYTALYFKARKIKKASDTMDSQPSSKTKSDEAFSNGKEIRGEEWKANITFFLLFFSGFLLSTAVVCVTLILVAFNRSYGPSPVLYVFQSLLSTMSSILVIADAVVIMRNGDVKEILHQLKGKIMKKM